ncbi:MAG TPA: PKD domain-containing protein [Flavobacteriales bacterium]|nr:PKD domain-containing protein [Flavobacteriales bacterium]
MTLAAQFKTSQLFATHAQGADISYQCLGGNNYQLMVSFYRDCAGVAAPGSVTVDVSSASCAQNYTVTLFPVAGTGAEVTPICAAMNTTCTGGSYPGVQEWKYSGTTNLPANCTDWVFSFTLCCRNAAINTINAPGSENIYVEANLDNLNYPCNNSPVFSNPPVPFVCATQTYCFNHGATDADGDSLAYSLITPMTGPATTVTYLPPYSATQPLNSVPAMTIDPLTGDICMTPQILEVTVMAVLVEEWRAGVLIGSVIRDIQVRVINCTNTVPEITGINGTSSFSTSVCAGSTLTFNVFSSDEDAGQILTLTWNNAITGATFTTTTAANPTGTFTWTPTAADISTTPWCFTVTVTDDACPFNGSQTFAFCITVTGLTLNVTPVDANCGMSTGSATSAVSGGTAPYTYAWSTGATGTTVGGLAAGAYTLTVSDAAGCTNTSNFNVGPGSVPAVINYTPTYVDCFGSATGAVTTTVASGGPIVSYAWSNGATTSALTGLTAGTYALTATNAGGCVTNTVVTITQPASAVALNVVKSDITCNGMGNGSATATPSGGTAPYNLNWSTGAATNTVTALAAGTYTCTVTDANGCSATSSVTINEPAAITVTSTTINDVTCTGLSNGSCVLGLTGGSGALSVSWSTTPVQTGTSVSGLSMGTYTYTVTDANGCAISNNINILEPAPLNLAVNSTNPTCYGLNDGTLQVNATGGTVPYIITVNAAGVANGSTLTALDNGSYTVIITDGHGCSTSQVVTLTEPSPVSIIVSPNLVICPGDNVTIYAYASGGSGTYAYNWSTGLGNNVTHVVSPASTTTYTVTVDDNNGCSSNMGTTVVTVNDINNITLNVTGNHDICVGESVSLSANVSGGIDAYSFSWNGGAQIGPGPHTFSPVSNTTYTVTTTDVCGNSASVPVPVVVNPLPIVTLPNIVTNGCGSVSIEFANGSPANPGDIYEWNIGGIASSEPEPSHNFSETGVYNYELTVTDANGCKSTANATATIQIFPQADAIIDAVSHTAGEFSPVIQFINASLFADTYNWSFGDGSVSTATQPHHTYSGEGTYTVTLIANNQYGCADTAQMEVNIHPEHTLYVPNAFTPNGNGNNEIFFAQGTHISEYEMMIFDRWGELIFTSKSLDAGWDGTVKGEMAKEDVYVYKIRYKTEENSTQVLSKEGHVTLLK